MMDNMTGLNTLGLRCAAASREQLRDSARRIVVKVGSAIITHAKGHLSAPRLASIVEQIAQLQSQGRQMLLVSSGAVAFGQKKLRDEMQKSKSIRQAINDGEKTAAGPVGMSRAAAAVGQSSLMSFYESLFQQYDCKVAQVLVTKADLSNESNRMQLKSTILGLLSLNIIPIINTNDAVETLVTTNVSNGSLDLKPGDMTDIIVEDNDSLAAILAIEIESDLMIMLSNVDGVYTGPPESRESKFSSIFRPSHLTQIEFGSKSNVGLGGMQAKVKSALRALKKGTSVVICNGSTSDIITRVVAGDRVGTFFTESDGEGESTQLASKAREGSKKLKSLGAEGRSKMISEIAQALQTKKSLILAANEKDLVKAKVDGLEDVLLARLKLTDAKIASLCDGLNQIALKSKEKVDKTNKIIQVSESLRLRQVTSPIGVLLVIFESRPDCLPQIASLSIATSNGLLLKGGKEAYFSNNCLYEVVVDVLKKYGCEEAIQLVNTRERVNELVSLGEHIDLIIPRGSNQLVKSIQKQAGSIPVLGHSEGICHVYIDEQANQEEAIRIAVDSKCNYPAACNAMETLLIHKSILNTNLFTSLCNRLKENNVKINIGAQLAKQLPLYSSCTTNYCIEYGGLECTLEVVNSLDAAIEHINKYGSGHTDAIVTSNETSAEEFKKHVDSASVFINCSTRFADGYRFGLGAEVGISTSKIHARGPAGMESLLTYKWILEGSGDVVGDYEGSGPDKKGYLHHEIDVE